MTRAVDVHVEPSARAQLLRWGEFLVLFVGAPLPFVLERSLMRGLMPTLMVFALGCLLYLLRDKTFDRRRLWGWAGLARELPRMLGQFAVGALLLAGLLALLLEFRRRGVIDLAEQVQWLALPRQDRLLWSMIMIGYPIVSVYPQELIYRAFLFQRYRLIFPTPGARVLASALVFGWVHLVFVSHDPVTFLPVGLCVLGGVLFAWTYERRGSLAAAWSEHALYGCGVFTIGLGWLFYGGSIAAARAVGP